MAGNIFFTADTHFDHKRVIGFQANRRHFRDPNLSHIIDDRGEISHPNEITAMRDAMIDGWNSVVGPRDEVWHLGDFSFGSKSANEHILSRLNGVKRLVTGNHDGKRLDALLGPDGFVSILPYAEIEFGGHIFCLMHYPILSWNGAERGSIHLHGHLHDNVRDVHFDHARRFRTMDVGIDAHPDFRPFSLDEVLSKMLLREPLPRHTGV